MELKRFWRHVLMRPAKALRAFPPATFDAIQREVALQEKRHRGEVCFVVEAELNSWQLWRDLAPRARARELFGLRGVWNTEENNGVLIYVLLADRSVEIVADRGIDKRVQPAEWQAICRAMEVHSGKGASRRARLPACARSPTWSPAIFPRTARRETSSTIVPR